MYRMYRMYMYVYVCICMYVYVWECGRKLPNRLPNFCLIDTKFCLISCLIACLIVRSSRYRNLGLILIGDALRDHPATPEMGTFVPNGRRHGASRRPCKNRKSD